MHSYIKYGIDLLKIKFDINYYKNYYTDLINLRYNDLITHFLLHGYKEKRLFFNLEKNFNWLQYYIDFKLDYDDINLVFQHFLYEYFINYEKYNEEKSNKILEINNKIQFNSYTYKTFNKDLKDMNNYELKEHFNNHGRNEKRKFIELIPEFNWCYYLVKYNLKNINTLDDLWNFYVYDHIKYSPNINFNIKINFNENLSTNHKIIYHKINNNNSLNNNNFPLTAIIYVYYNRKDELRNETNLSFFIRQTVLKDNKNLYLFIINGHLTEVVIPKQKNVIVYSNYNCYDIEAYGIGIKHVLNINKSIERIVLMNCGVTGPFYETSNWLSKFENKLKSENASICSTVVYRFNNQKYVPGYFMYFLNKPNIINLLSKVLIKYYSKTEIINNGEYGISRILLENGYKITSLIDNNIDGYRSDRDNNLNKYTVYDLVFVKTNWRSLDCLSRDSIPIKNYDCINEINKISNFKFDKFNNINYDILNINISSDKWISKMQFYNIYGHPEQFIIYPTICSSKNIAIYCHSDKDNLFRSYCIDAVNTLSLLGYKVVVCTTCITFKNISKFPYEKIVILDAKTDGFMYKQYINYTNLNNYEKLLIVNDTIIFPIHGINNMKRTFDKFNGIDFWGIWNSPEQKEHIMSPFLHFSKRTFNFLKKILNEYSFVNFESGQQFEINLLDRIKSCGFTTDVVVNYRSLGNINYKCPIMHPDVFPRWINRAEVFAIKWKYIGNYLNKNKLNIPYMNYLLRYLHFNHTGIIGKPEQDGAYKNPLNYM